METFQEQKEFFQARWNGMREAAESGGAQGIIGFIQGFDDPLERRVLYIFARQGLVMQEWEGRTFDAYIDVCNAGVREFLEQAAGETDPELRRRRVNGANVLSYNLTADLADCWPGDEAARHRAHFEAGLKAAEDCIVWREELRAGPGPHSMAWWAKGMHQLSLGNTEGAVESWTRSRDYAVKAATEEEGWFGVVLGEGYVGLAEWALGEETGRARYDKAIADFRGRLEDEEQKGDAQFGIDQLEAVRSRYIGS